MHGLMVLCEGIDTQDVATFRSGGIVIPDASAVKVDVFAAAAVAENEHQTLINPGPVTHAGSENNVSIVAADDTVLRAMRWASGLHDEGALLGLIVELPEQIVKEQVFFLHGQEQSKPKQEKHDETIVVESHDLELLEFDAHFDHAFKTGQTDKKKQ